MSRKGLGVQISPTGFSNSEEAAVGLTAVVPFSIEELYDATFATLAANGLNAAYIRPLVFRGYGEMGLFPLNAPVDVSIAAWPWGAYLGEEGIKHGIRAKISSIQSLDHTALARAAKATGHYLNSILAKIEVTNAGYDEAIMLTEHLSGKTVRQNNSQSPLAIAGLLSFVALVAAVIVKTPWPVTQNALKAKISVLALGEALMGSYVFPFEVISIVLIAVLIGTVVIAKKDTPEGRS